MAESSGWPSHYRWMIPILLMAFLLRIAYLDAQSLWWDEAMSVAVGNMDLPSAIENRTAGGGAAGFLYFLAIHFWLRLGQGEFVVRLLSVIFGVLAVAGMFPLATLIGAKRLGVTSAFALAISPFHIWYSQEARMYSLLLLLTVLSVYFFIRLLREDRLSNWMAYGIFTLAAMYTHYITPFVIIAQLTYLTLMRRRYRTLLGKWLLCMLALGALLTPWLILSFSRGGLAQAPISWIPAPRPADLFWTIYDLGLGSTSDSTHPLHILAALSFTAILAYVSFRLLRGRIMAEQRDRLWFVWLWLILPLVLVFLISLDWPLAQKRSVYVDRYFSPLVPSFLILVCHGTKQIFRKKSALGLLVAAVMLVAVSISVCSLFVDQRYHREQWRQAITEIKENARGGDILLVRPHHYVPLYYYDLREIPWFTVPYLGSAEDYEVFLDTNLPHRLSEGGKLWTMVVCENANPHRFAQGRSEELAQKVLNDELRAWLMANYDLLSEETYVGVYLASYGTSPSPALSHG